MSYTSSQRSAIQQLQQFTNCSEKSAVKFLKANSWSVEHAADAYLNAKHARAADSHGGASRSSGGSSDTKATQALNAIFDQFRQSSDPDDTMGVEGCMAYLQSINVGLEEPTVIVIAEILKAPTMGEFSRDGFVTGWKQCRVSSLDQMRELVPTLRNAFDTDEELFKRVYKYTFNFARTGNQKGLSLEVAVEYWKLLLADRFGGHLDSWIEFLENVYKRSINKDTWNCMYDFVVLARGDPTLDSYDTDGAWPSILDDYVNFWREKKKNEMEL